MNTILAISGTGGEVGGGRITGNDPGGRISMEDLYWNPPPKADQNP